MTFGKPPKKTPGMSYAEVETIKNILDLIPDAKTLQQQYGDEYCVIWEELKTIHLVEGPDEVLDIDRTHLSKGTISVIDDYIRRSRVARKKQPRHVNYNFRKAENNEHRTPRRSNPTVARPVLSRTSGLDAERTRIANQGLFEQGFRRPAEVERAVYSAIGEGYDIFYPGYPPIRGGRSGRGDQ